AEERDGTHLPQVQTQGVVRGILFFVPFGGRRGILSVHVGGLGLVGAQRRGRIVPGARDPLIVLVRLAQRGPPGLVCPCFLAGALIGRPSHQIGPVVVVCLGGRQAQGPMARRTEGRCEHRLPTSFSSPSPGGA